MSVAHQVHTGAVAEGARPAPAVVKTPWWDRPALFRYGFVAVILIVWQIVGPFINPIFFTYPTTGAAIPVAPRRPKLRKRSTQRPCPASCPISSGKAWKSWSTA